jgi:sulfur carrier protein
MKLTVNGAAVETPEGLSVRQLLAERKVKTPEMVSVELNGEILERTAFEKTPLKEGDKLEFLYFMGGGDGTH